MLYVSGVMVLHFVQKCFWCLSSCVGFVQVQVLLALLSAMVVRGCEG